MKPLVLWRHCGPKNRDLVSSCGRFEIRERGIDGTMTYHDKHVGDVHSVRLFLIDHVNDAVHVFRPDEDATKYASAIVAAEGKPK